MFIRVLSRGLLTHKLPSFSNIFSGIRPSFCNTQYFSTASNPRILASHSQPSQCGNQVTVGKILQRYGFPSSELPYVFDKNKFLLNLELPEVEKCLRILLSSFKLPQNVVVPMISRCPGVFEFDFLNKWEGSFSELGAFGSAPSMVCSVLQFSRRFQRVPDEFVKCVQVLKGFGLGDGTISKVLEDLPGVMMISECELRKRMGFFVIIGMERDEIDSIYSAFPGALRFSVEDRLKPLFDEFGQLGLGIQLMKQEVVREPRILDFELGELPRYVEFLYKLKCRVPIKEMIFSDGELRAGFALKLRVDCLRRYGLIHRDALSVLQREPRAITYDIEDIEKKIDFLIRGMNYNISSLIEYPQYLGVNFEKQILPRYNVIEYLRSKGGLGLEVGLRDLMKPSRSEFYKLYVMPYPDCEEIYGRNSVKDESKRQHPTGLWKLFNPPKSGESDEDVRGMKIFMESLG